MDQKAIMIFILGFLLGGFIVMLFWVSSPGCMNVDLFGGTEVRIDSPARELNATPSLLVASDSSGRTIATTGQMGTPAEFIDTSGRVRNVVCYTSVYCVDETPCPPCDEEECVDNGRMCGYWPGQTGTLAANMQTEGIEYGECCPPYDCYEGYCRPGQEEECVDYGEMCGRAQDTSVTTHVAYKDYGECCLPYECVNNRCGRETEECVPTGELCGYVSSQTATHATTPTYYGECCEPDECIDNKCTPPGEEECVDYGLTCGRVQDPTITTHVAYKDYGECCPPYECTNNKCIEGGCQEQGEQCEYGPNYGYTTAAPTGATWFGECCSPLLCISGFCSENCVDIGETCVDGQIPCCEGYCVNGKCAECKTSGSCTPGAGECCTGYRCWDFKCVAECTSEGGKCGKDSDCCGSLICYDGVCAEEQDCGEEGQTCGLGVECCEELYCSDNDVCTECAPVGDYCGQYTGAGGVECCPDAFCYLGFCEEKTDELCTDTENGPDYYSQGTATGIYAGDYGVYTDYCLNDNTVMDYYCQVNNEYSEVLAGTVTCPQGCSQGRCN